MTNAQLLALGVRLFCIWLVVYLLRHVPALWLYFARDNFDREALTVVAVTTIVLVIVVVILWNFPLAVARKLLPRATLDTPTSTALEQLQSALFSLVGIWLISEAVPRFVHFSVVAYQANKMVPPIEMTAASYASVVETIVQFILGVWLLFGARALLRLIRWARGNRIEELPADGLNESRESAQG